MRSIRNVAACRLALAAAGLTLLTPAVALGAEDHRLGSKTDPVGDATIAAEEGGGAGARLIDIRRVLADYESVGGALKLTFEGDQLYNSTHAAISFKARISAPNASGRCDGTLRAGDFALEASGSGGYDQPGEATLRTAQGTTVASGTVDFSTVTPVVSITAPALARRNFRCISGVSGTRGISGYATPSTDAVGDFCLAECPVPTTSTAAAPVIRASGTTLTWGRVGSVTSYVVATSNGPQGTPGRTTTYRTVTGTSYTPPVVRGATRYYGVRANVANAPWSNPEARITFSG